MAPHSVVVTPSHAIVPQGPFGGPGGDPFYDGVGDVVQITITYSSQVVWSVQANYRQTTGTTHVFHGAHHGSKGPQVAEIKLDFPNERLMQVTGTTAPAGGVTTDVVTSLTFITTKNTYGPFGAVDGRPFQSSSEGKVVGFFGRSGSYIDAFGTFTDFAHTDTNLIPDGPWGGNGGNAYYDRPADKIKQIDVEYDGAAIISLNVTYDRGSQGFVSSKHGGSGSVHGTTKTVVFGDDEYLAQVTGTSGLAHGTLTLVTSLSFITDKTVYGPFGNVSGDPFQTRPHAQIVGFYGRSGWLLDQIGAFVGTTPSHSAVAVAHFGGHGGAAFYEGRGQISQIVVTYLKGQLVAKLQVTYLQGGEQFVGALHGGADGDMSGDVATIPLNSPDEHLVQVKGTHGPAKGVEDLILSIQFITNKKTYGPYGNPGSGTPFASPSFGNMTNIVGLFGRSGYWLDQIGVICFEKLMG